MSLLDCILSLLGEVYFIEQDRQGCSILLYNIPPLFSLPGKSHRTIEVNLTLNLFGFIHIYFVNKTVEMLKDQCYFLPKLSYIQKLNLSEKMLKFCHSLIDHFKAALSPQLCLDIQWTFDQLRFEPWSHSLEMLVINCVFFLDSGGCHTMQFFLQLVTQFYSLRDVD